MFVIEHLKCPKIELRLKFLIFFFQVYGISLLATALLTAISPPAAKLDKYAFMALRALQGGDLKKFLVKIIFKK
jgi:hypothetical protein